MTIASPSWWLRASSPRRHHRQRSGSRERLRLLKSRSATLENSLKLRYFFYAENAVNAEEAAKVLADGGREALELFAQKLKALDAETLKTFITAFRK